MTPESHLTTGEAQRWRLIPHHGNGSVTIDGTLAQADECGKELSSICGCRVLVTQLRADCTPINHHSVGKTRVKPKPINQEDTQMGTTKMSPDPRTTNGEKGDVVTDIDSAKSITAEQKATLKQKRDEAAANGNSKSTTKKSTPKAKTEPKPRAPKGISKQDLGHELTLIRRTLKTLPDESHEVATSIRKILSKSWSEGANIGNIENYISTVREAREIAHKAKLSDTVKAMDAAVKLAEKAQSQKS